MNGTFEPTTEEQNGLPVYKKKGDDGFWVEAVKGASGWRWYLKPKKNKGPDSSVCFAYINFTPATLGFPHDVDGKWYVSCADGFVAQDTVTTVGVGGSSDHLNSTLEATRVKMKAAEEEAQREVCSVTCNALWCLTFFLICALFIFVISCLLQLERPPIAGSFTIAGATGKSAGSVNGTYEPVSGEKQHDLPVYKKKGPQNLYCEAAKGGTSGMRWYVKPAANRGPESTICFGYAAINEDAKALPQDSTGWTVNTADGFKMQESITVMLASTEPVPDNMNPMHK